MVKCDTNQLFNKSAGRLYGIIFCVMDFVSFGTLIEVGLMTCECHLNYKLEIL